MNARHRLQGMALVSAILLIVVLVALGAAMASLSTVQEDTGNKALLAAKVYYGARSGLEWGTQRAIAAGTCGASTAFTLTQGGLNGVDLTVQCSKSTYGGTNDVYTISS